MTLFTQVERNLPYLTERYVGLAPNGTIDPLMCGAEVLASVAALVTGRCLWLPRLNII